MKTPAAAKHHHILHFLTFLLSPANRLMVTNPGSRYHALNYG